MLVFEYKIPHHQKALSRLHSVQWPHKVLDKRDNTGIESPGKCSWSSSRPIHAAEDSTSSSCAPSLCIYVELDSEKKGTEEIKPAGFAYVALALEES